MLLFSFYFLLFSCQIGNQNDIPTGSPKEKALDHLKQISILSKQVEQSALELESAIDESRRAIQQGSNPIEENKKLKGLMDDLEQKNQHLQDKIIALEQQLVVEQ